jgi:TolB-like protein/Flp pilus assembly protein TadD
MLYRFEDYELDVDRHELRAKGELRVLEPQVFELLRHLIENHGRLISRDELINVVWRGRIVSESAIDQRVHAARKAIDDDGRQQQRIKTVPKHGYRFVADVDEIGGNGQSGNEPRAPDREQKVSFADKASIAVLPFENMSGDAEQEYFADGMTEDIITELSRYRSLFVIARNSTFAYKGTSPDVRDVAQELGVRYVLEGSVRKASERVRISAQLIDAIAGNHLWAERFDSNLENVFDLQDQITGQIVVSVQPEIEASERERARRIPPDSLDAWELVHRGLAHFYRINKEDRMEAIRLFKEATVVDPEFAAAHAHLAYALCASGMLGFAEDRVKAVASTRKAAEKAVTLDPNEPMGHYVLGRIYIVVGEIEMAIAEMKSAIAVNPNFPRGHYGLGFAYHFGAGQPEPALPHYDNALRLSPRDITRWVTLMFKGSALSMLGRHEEAVGFCRQACQFLNAGFQPHMHLAVTLARAGEQSEARKALDRAIELEPGLTAAFVRNHFFGMHEAMLDDILDSLKSAGLAE